MVVTTVPDFGGSWPAELSPGRVKSNGSRSESTDIVDGMKNTEGLSPGRGDESGVKVAARHDQRASGAN